MTTYTEIFGNATVPPSGFAYRAVALTADVTLAWPDNSTGTDLVASIMGVTPTGGAWTITLPPADEVSTGRDVLLRNLGAISFSIVDSASGAVTTVAAGEAKYIYITDNSTAAGTWAVFTYGTGTSAVDAATLAGYGLAVDGTTLESNLEVTEVSGVRTISASDRAMFLVHQGGANDWVVPDASGLGNGFWCAINNAGTGTLTLTGVAASNTIDESTTKQLQPGESCFLGCGGGSDWFTIGYGRSVDFEFTQLSVDVTAGGAMSITSAQAANKLWYFYNTAATNVTMTIPAVASVYFLRIGAIGAGKTITFTTGSGATLELGGNQSQVIYCDGTNVVSAQTVAVSVVVSLGDGSVGNPSLYFNLDSDTGLYRVSNNVLGLAVGGVAGATFSATTATLPAVNKVAITQPASSATLTIANGKTLTASNTLTLTGTDGSSVNFKAGGTAAMYENLQVNVKNYGATGDGVTDDTAAIQAAIDVANTAGGGEVFFPRGTYLISSTLTIYSKVILVGEGSSSTEIKLKDSSVSTGADCAMIKSYNYDNLEGSNSWLVDSSDPGMPTWVALTNYAINMALRPTVANGCYYLLTTDAGSSGATEPVWPTTIGDTVVDGGLTWTCLGYSTHGYGLKNLRLNGNKANQGVGVWAGVRFYGKRLRINDVIITSCAGEGWHSEANYNIYGQPANNGDDLPEGMIDGLYIWECDSHGMVWRGQHDSKIGSLWIGLCGGWGLRVETDTTAPTQYSGAFDFDLMHIYANTLGGVYVDFDSIIQGSHLISENNYGVGILCVGWQCKAAIIQLYSNCTTAAATAWLTGTSYVIGDRRTEAGVTYNCLTAHTSGVFATDLAAGKWLTEYQMIVTGSQNQFSDVHSRTVSGSSLRAGMKHLYVDGAQNRIGVTVAGRTEDAGGITIDGQEHIITGSVYGVASTGIGVQLDANDTVLDVGIVGYSGASGIGLLTNNLGSNANNNISAVITDAATLWNHVNSGTMSTYEVRGTRATAGTAYTGAAATASESWDVALIVNGVTTTISRVAGNLTFLSGNGIDFSAVTGGTGTATANLLDDYEEGTFTPVIRDAIAGNAATVTNTHGRYTKIGRTVSLTVTFEQINTTGLTAGNQIHLTGLPFTVSSSTPAHYPTASVQKLSTTATAGSLSAIAIQGASYMLFYNETTTGRSSAIVSQMTSTTAGFNISLTYDTAL